MSETIEVQISKKDDNTVSVKLAGAVSSETYIEFEKLLQPVVELNAAKVLIDMNDCNYVSSAGIRVFFDLRRKVTANSGVLSFHNMQPQIKKVFEIVKALPLECIFTDEKQADAYLERMMDEELKKQGKSSAGTEG